ncbi:MAG: EamA-like transporter family protein [Planctomycetaceae bacterium]|nr:EamA-like transporter family protein [Planctomycetaceae bacterium]
MHTSVFALLAMGAGACIALQASANGKFRQNLGEHPQFALWAMYFSIIGTIVTATAVMVLIRPPMPSAEALRGTQWWNWIGGPLGALIVLAGAALTRELGAALFIALVVGGQLLCSLILDHHALLGLSEQPVTLGRLLGALLVVAGVLCIKYL